jgi:Ni/Co efflux regulator RcnB
MRKLLISLLLASAMATPALADPGDHSDRQAAHEEHQQARAERQERATSERPQFNGHSNFNGATNGGGQQSFARSRGFQQGVQQTVSQVDPAQTQAFHGQHVRGQRQGFQGQVSGESLRQSDRPLPNVLRTHNRSPMVSDIPRRGTQPPLRVDNRHRGDVAWNRDWRHDGRYDWHSWRDRHRSIFHLGFYYDPFGWGYQPFDIGWRLWPNYYSSNYWISDPYEYRLPYAPPGTRWIRYYNDALLVDTYTGQVVDVIRDFFW